MGDIILTGVVISIYREPEDTPLIETTFQRLYATARASEKQFLVHVRGTNGWDTYAVLPSGSKCGWPSEKALKDAAKQLEDAAAKGGRHYITRICNGPDYTGHEENDE